MAVSFFQALNPASKNSGVLYPSYVVDQDYLGQEIVDSTVSENISSVSRAFDPGFRSVFEILVGTHYSFGYLGQCSKGILDYLIFPLVSRKILHEIENSNIFVKVLGWIIALPLEIARFTLGISLTLLIAPIVALANFFKSCFSNPEPIINQGPQINTPDRESINLSSLNRDTFMFNTCSEPIRITTIPDRNYDSKLMGSIGSLP
nr:hypothetical protein [Legionella jordanis]